jgi:hypothetical protein
MELKSVKLNLETESIKVANAATETDKLKFQAEQDKKIIDYNNKLKEQFGFAAISEQLKLKRGGFEVFNDYKITLTNTDNILNNIDLRIQYKANKVAQEQNSFRTHPLHSQW